MLLVKHVKNGVMKWDDKIKTTQYQVRECTCVIGSFAKNIPSAVNLCLLVLSCGFVKADYTFNFQVYLTGTAVIVMLTQCQRNNLRKRKYDGIMIIRNLCFISHDGVIKWKQSSSLLALCEDNPPVAGGFSSQRPLTHSFDVFIALRLNKRFSKHSRARWFETLSRSLWRHKWRWSLYPSFISLCWNMDSCICTQTYNSTGKVIRTFRTKIFKPITKKYWRICFMPFSTANSKMFSDKPGSHGAAFWRYVKSKPRYTMY